MTNYPQKITKDWSAAKSRYADIEELKRSSITNLISEGGRSEYHYSIKGSGAPTFPGHFKPA
jgi:penicillin V acylase-like amidase (Ntn superfamily)